jgi:hypothetical protein
MAYDDDDEGRDILDRIMGPLVGHVDWEKAMEVCEELGSGHFDLDAETERLRARYEARQERAKALLRGLSTPVDEREVMALFREAGITAEALDDAESAVVLEAIRRWRRRSN